jgi:AcrR family transcriptional regulator
MSAAPTRTDRRRARNRDAILVAAEALFGARGIDAVSIDEIAEAADIAKGTVYNHFEDKDALATEIAAQARADGEARVAAANAGVSDPLRRTVRGVLVFARFAWERPDRARAMVRLSPDASDPHKAVNQGLMADIVSGIDAGRFSGIRVETGTLLVMGTAQMLMIRLMATRLSRAEAEELARDIAGPMLRGLGVPHETAFATAAAEAADIF